ncbi:DUF4372 domain-containing protein [Prevotella sp. A2931]|uniref:DUF4372 domain-containing protein n=1 Tax=Prevotella illustrans TaxID=2800387 RepID=A0ABS3M499_9BACT|nr:DUF4372 domain-containing protein [Prevotella illustrans]
MTKITLFAQVIQQLPKDLIKSLIKKHGTDKHAKGFNTWSHLVSMIFCQFADCVSLREISNGLRSANGNLNHLGILRAPSKSNIAYQNEKRSCAFFRECYYKLLNYFGNNLEWLFVTFEPFQLKTKSYEVLICGILQQYLLSSWKTCLAMKDHIETLCLG